MEMLKCELCDSEVLNFTSAPYIGKCSRCGLLQNFETKPPSNLEGEEFSGYLSAQDLAFEEKRRLKVLHRLQKLLTDNRLELSVFDIGTGSGLFLKDATQMGFSVSGNELSNSAANLVRSEYGFEIFVRDFEELGFSNCHSSVTMFCVLAHSVNPSLLVKSIQKSLRVGGILYFHTPRFCLIDSVAISLNYLSRGRINQLLLRRVGGDHRRIYSKKSLKRLLIESGFIDFTIKSEMGYGLRKENYFSAMGFPLAISKIIAQVLNLCSVFKLLPRNVYTVYATKVSHNSSSGL